MKARIKQHISERGIPSGLFVHSELLLDQLIRLGPQATLREVMQLRDESRATVFEWSDAFNQLLLYIGQHADSIPIKDFRQWLGIINSISVGLALSPVQVSDMRVMLVLKNYYWHTHFAAGDKALELLRNTLATEFGLSQNAINNLAA